MNVVLWGIVLMCHAIPNTFAPFFVLRILLGISLLPFSSVKVCHLIIFWFSTAGMLESCVAPILILIISMFYKKNEQVRFVPLFTYDNDILSAYALVL